MLIEVLQSPITIDKREMIKDLRINIPKGKRQLRMKLTCINNGEHPVDVVIFGFTNPKIDKLTNITMSIDGKDMKNDKSFRFYVKLYLLKMEWELSGNIGQKNINVKLTDIGKLFEILSEFI